MKLSDRKIYLYIKISPLGLFYLGKFVERKKVRDRNIYSYSGSGFRWTNHLKANNIKPKDLETIVLHESYDIDEIKKLGIYYSRLLNVIESNKWANLKEETGDSSGKLSKESSDKIREANKKRINSDSSRKKRSIASKAIVECPYCHKKGGSHVLKRYHFENCPVKTGHKVDNIKCIFCDKEGNIANMKRWHFDNCKFKHN